MRRRDVRSDSEKERDTVRETVQTGGKKETERQRGRGRRRECMGTAEDM